MRRVAVFVAAASLALPVSAAAQRIGPVAGIDITVAEEVTRKRDLIGEREIEFLIGALRDAVEDVVVMAPEGGRLELTIANASPNRPTWTQMRRQPGISYIGSYGIGGAEVEGVYIAPDGTRTPVHYRWYENDIRNSRIVGTWHDVDRTFRRFALRLGEG